MAGSLSRKSDLLAVAMDLMSEWIKIEKDRQIPANDETKIF